MKGRGFPEGERARPRAEANGEKFPQVAPAAASGPGMFAFTPSKSFNN